MILLPVSESEALDYLSILIVKESNGLPVSERRKEIHACLESHGLSHSMMTNLFEELILVNARCYHAVDLAMEDKISAKEVQLINRQRFELKRKIQNELFGGSKHMEVKSA